MRIAQEIEALRLKTEKSGRRPKVFMLCHISVCALKGLRNKAWRVNPRKILLPLSGFRNLTGVNRVNANN